MYIRTALMYNVQSRIWTPCESNSPYADTFRIDGLEDRSATELLGGWDPVKSVYQYKDWESDTPYFNIESTSRWRRTIYFNKDTIAYLESPFELFRAHSYAVKKDSIYIDREIGSSMDERFANTCYQFKGDTLILITAPDGFCHATVYQFYIPTKSDLNIMKSVVQNRIDWELFRSRWELTSYFERGHEQTCCGPKILDLTEANEWNYRFGVDSLFYLDTSVPKDKGYCFIFDDFYKWFEYDSIPTLRLKTINADRPWIKYELITE